MMERKRILVFVLADLSGQHGGNVWLQSLFCSLSRVEDFDFTIVTTGREQAGIPNGDVVRGFGFQHVFLPLSVPLGASPSGPLCRIVATCLDKYYFDLERWADRQGTVDSSFKEVIHALKPSLILVSDIWSAMCCRSTFEGSIPCCLITLNDEIVFHCVSRRMGGPSGPGIGPAIERTLYRNGNWIANYRLKRYARKLFERCAGVIALTERDLPTDVGSAPVQAVLPPLLKESSLLWSYSGTRSILFVGNIGHFPNRIAVEWLCNRLSPVLYEIDKDIVINVIGAESFQGVRCKKSNIRFLGLGTRRDVTYHMTNDDLFIAPIENRFGAKLKLAECASFGMPFVATRAAMSGLSFMKCVPLFELEKPLEAARLIVEILAKPSALSKMSRQILQEMKMARVEQAVQWKRFLEKAATKYGPDENRERSRAVSFESDGMESRG